MLCVDDDIANVASEIEAGKIFDDLPPSLAKEELMGLANQGTILAPVKFPKPQKLRPKSLCLIVSHACNMACSYCSLSSVTGQGKLMPPNTAKKVLDWLVPNAPGGKIDVDFFGGEPLLAWNTVKQAILHGEMLVKEHGKTIRWSMSTNALGLTDEVLEFCDRHYVSLILSLDGPKEQNDEYRLQKDGSGSFDKIIPKIIKIAGGRNVGYYVRGTYTKKTLNFSDSVIALHKMGIKSLAFEPVVSNDPSIAITEKELTAIRYEYEKLAKYYVECKRNDKSIRYYHFEVDLESGPCDRKMAGGCGAGAEYLAISPDGTIWPCHQLDGLPKMKMGGIEGPPSVSDYVRYTALGHITGKPVCQNCWAAYLCSGGCLASNLLIEGRFDSPYKIGCEIQKMRLEAALWVYAQLKS